MPCRIRSDFYTSRKFRRQEFSREIQWAWLVLETDIIYLPLLVYGDQVIVKTWSLDFGRVRQRRACELRCSASGDMVARATTV